MRSILVIGAGRSSSSLIKYLLDNALQNNWTVVVADVSEQLAQSKTANHPSSKAVSFDINNEALRTSLISDASLVISMLPANMHMPVALECLGKSKNLITASYVSAAMDALNADVTSKGLLFLNECGLDPGLDHMSAMEIIDNVREQQGELISFRSYTGGLVAPESNDNPWGYKFSWNPRNVILAGQGTARYIEEGKYKYIPYNRLFRQAENIHIDELGDFDGYANRDSLSYRKTYGLNNIPTMIRGTLRQSLYCSAWNVFVCLGLTDDSYILEGSDRLSYAEIVESFLPDNKSLTLRERVASLSGLPVDSTEMKMVEWTGIFSPDRPGLKDATPAQILQHLLESKWKLKEGDRDMIVMQHQFEYVAGNKRTRHISSLVVKGEDNVYTAMAKTVGLPMAIAAKHVMNGAINLKGVRIPVDRQIYQPILKELKESGISFIEKRSQF